MTPSAKRNLLAGIVALCLLVTGGYAVFIASNNDEAAREGERFEVPTQDAVLFRNASGGADDDRVSLSTTADVSARKLSDLRCQRIYFDANRGLCLAANRSRTSFVAKIVDRKLDVVHELPASGLPSRARVSQDGRYGASTAFVFGHSYADGQFSTETVLYDMLAGTRIAQLEDFETFVDGKRIDAPDVNFWGVTFTADANVFYATLMTNGNKYLVRGDIAAKRMTKIGNDVECPSVSPDQTRIAYKKAVTKTLWRLHVMDLATMKDVEVSETRSIDDQVEWFDNSTLAYGTVEQDVYRVPADGSGAPQLWMSDASSPSVLG